MILQLGVKFSWFNTCSTTNMFPHQIPEISQTSAGDLRGYMIESALPPVGDSVVPELLLKVLEPYRREGAFSFCTAILLQFPRNLIQANHSDV